MPTIACPHCYEPLKLHQLSQKGNKTNCFILVCANPNCILYNDWAKEFLDNDFNHFFDLEVG